MNLLRPRNRPAGRQAASPGRVLVRVLDNLQGCLRARPCGPARIYTRLHGLATIPGEKCGLVDQQVIEGKEGNSIERIEQ
jgi:hypothetical protein